jgi:predicted nucleic-acid-binding protein
MIGLDTNILIRYYSVDDPEQFAIAAKFLQSLTRENPGFISTPTLLEFVWVITSTYKLSRESVVSILSSLLHDETLRVQSPELAKLALEQYSEGKADYGDCMITMCSRSLGCNQVMTFDRIAARDAGMTLLT